MKKHLECFARKIVSQYGYSSFYSKTQIELVIKKYNFKKDINYIFILFEDTSLLEKTEIEDQKKHRKSLYLYFDPYINDGEILNNEYYKILNLGNKSKIPGSHTITKVNSNAFWGGGKYS